MKLIVFLDIDNVVAIDPNFSGSTVAAALKNNRNIEEKFWASVFLSSAVSNLSLLHEDFFPRMLLAQVGRIISTVIKLRFLLILQGLVLSQKIFIVNGERRKQN